MKKLTRNIIALSGMMLMNSAVISAQIKDDGLNLSYRDTSVRPQDDFYTYVNGGWMKTAQIPSDKATWGSFNQLREDVDNNSLEILKTVLKEKYPANSEGEKIQALYGTFLDWDKRNAEGIKPIKSQLAKIEAIKKYVPNDYEFDVPQKLLQLYNNKDYGIYKNQNGDIPVNFTATNHTTGGNSGSPALDAYGNLVGLNFDRQWEGTMSDINYDAKLCRNIMVDTKYILFIIDKYANAKWLLDEMKIVK